MSSHVVKQVDHTAPADWNRFVLDHPRGTFFHLAEWKQVLEAVYGFETYYLYAEDHGAVCGVLPLALVRRPLFGNVLISTPLCAYGGVVASDPAIAAALESRAERIAVDRKLAYFECRNVVDARIDWHATDRYATFRKALPADPDAILQTISRKERADIRKGTAAGLDIAVEHDTDAFFDIYATSVRNLGTPTYPKRYFETLRAVFGEACEILTVRAGDRPVCGVLSFYFRDEVLPYYAGGLPVSRDLKGYNFMYWRLMQHACGRGARLFDFGRSPLGSGAYAFKRNWGFEPIPLHYRYRLVRAQQVPDVTPTNPKFRFMIEAWKRLPLPIANRLGPRLVPLIV